MAFLTYRTGQPEVWIRSPRGEWENPIVTQKDFPDEKTISFSCAVLSPDGQRVAYSRSGEKTANKIWISPSSGGRPAMAVPGVDQADPG